MEALTLQEAKDQIAKKYSYANWADLIIEDNMILISSACEEVMKAYSLLCQEALRENNIETIDMWRINNEDQIGRDPVGMVDNLIKSIRNTPLITE